MSHFLGAACGQKGKIPDKLNLYTHSTMSAVNKNGTSRHRAGHTLGDFPKRTSIGNGKRKRGSYKLQGKKRSRGQGR